MKCPRCGSEINEGALFCTSCGMQIVQNETEKDNNSQINVPNTNSKKNQVNGNKTPWALIIAVIIMAVVVVAIFVGVNMSREEASNKNKEENTTVENNNQEKNETPKEENSKTVDYNNFTFTIPEKYIATPSESQLLVLSSDGLLAEAIIYQTGTPYSTLSSMKNQIVDLLKSQDTSQSEGYDFTNAVTEEKNYDGTKFLITSGIKQGEIDLDITYAETDNGVFVISIAKTNGSITENEREELYSIVASANTNNM